VPPPYINYGYEDATSTTAQQLIPFSDFQYANSSIDDGDYFIQQGSSNIIQQFKSTHTNNTDNITISWKGRTTIAPSASPVYLQIYNFNTLTWNIISSQTVKPSDTDFILTGTQTINLSNYYDSNFNVVARIYQQVV